jgi:hypothetical protein
MLDFHSILIRSTSIIWNPLIPYLLTWHSDLCSFFAVSHLSGNLLCNTRSRKVSQAVNLPKIYELVNILRLAEMANLFTAWCKIQNKRSVLVGVAWAFLFAPVPPGRRNEIPVAAHFCTVRLFANINDSDIDDTNFVRDRFLNPK